MHSLWLAIVMALTVPHASPMDGVGGGTGGGKSTPPPQIRVTPAPASTLAPADGVGGGTGGGHGAVIATPSPSPTH